MVVSLRYGSNPVYINNPSDCIFVAHARRDLTSISERREEASIQLFHLRTHVDWPRTLPLQYTEATVASAPWDEQAIPQFIHRLSFRTWNTASACALPWAVPGHLKDDDQSPHHMHATVDASDRFKYNANPLRPVF